MSSRPADREPGSSEPNPNTARCVDQSEPSEMSEQTCYLSSCFHGSVSIPLLLPCDPCVNTKRCAWKHKQLGKPERFRRRPDPSGPVRSAARTQKVLQQHVRMSVTGWVSYKAGQERHQQWTQRRKADLHWLDFNTLHSLWVFLPYLL